MDRWTWRVGGSLALALLWLSVQQPAPPVASAKSAAPAAIDSAETALTTSEEIVDVEINLDPEQLPFAEHGPVRVPWPHDRWRQQPAPTEDDAPRMLLSLVHSRDWSVCKAAPWVPDAMEAALTQGTFFLWSLTNQPFGPTPKCVREPALEAFLEVARAEGYVPPSAAVLADPTRAAVAASIAAWRADLANRMFRRAWLQRFAPDADLDTVEGYRRAIALAEGHPHPTPPPSDASMDLKAVRDRWGDHPAGQLASFGVMREEADRLHAVIGRRDVLDLLARTSDRHLVASLMWAAYGWARDVPLAETDRQVLEDRLGTLAGWGDATPGWRFLIGVAVRRGDLAEVDRLHAIASLDTEENFHPSLRPGFRAQQRHFHVWRVLHGARPDDWLAAAQASLWRCAADAHLPDAGEVAFVDGAWESPADCRLPTTPRPPEGAKVRWTVTGAGDPVVASAAVSGASPTRR